MTTKQTHQIDQLGHQLRLPLQRREEPPRVLRAGAALWVCVMVMMMCVYFDGLIFLGGGWK